VIVGGKLVDGTSNPWYVADVAVKDRRIAAIGRGLEARGARTIDAAGKIVSPGFIDIHSHSDRGLADPTLKANLNNGGAGHHALGRQPGRTLTRLAHSRPALQAREAGDRE
jgi:N-acyl-D-aspartate/D-glutamate deacylase